jgi:deoxyribonuclease-4
MILGAHVSSSGGVHLAPARGAKIGATAIQVFTKSPNQWRDPAVPPDARAALAKSMSEHDIRSIFAHDSYLINIASPDPSLNAKSRTAFERELSRCETLGIPFLVSHPGNYIDDRERAGSNAMPNHTSFFVMFPNCQNPDRDYGWNRYITVHV